MPRRIEDHLRLAYPSFPGLRIIALRCKEIRMILKEDPRRVIPAAHLARIYNVSERSLWNWIRLGWIQKRPAKEGAARLKRGIDKTKALKFVERVAKVASSRLKKFTFGA